jgi:undecaprenyl-diphosphatase
MVVSVSDVTAGVRPDRTGLRPPSLRDRLMPAASAWRVLVACWLALLLAVTAAGLLLVGPFEDGWVARWDLDIERWLLDRRTDALTSLAEAGTWLSETITVPVVLLVAIVIAWRVSANVAAPVYLALAVGGEKRLYLIASWIVDRDRPPVPTVGTTYATASFPSGHVASAFVLYGALALLVALKRSTVMRAALVTLAAVVTIVVALCRMYTGFHYLSDCIAGALAAAIWLTVVYRAVLLPAEAVAAAAFTHESD